MRSHFLRTVNASVGGGGVLIARPVSISGWDSGAYTDIDEVTAVDSDNVYTWDTSGTNEVQAVTVGFGSLSIASSGDCILRFRQTQFSSGSIETNPAPSRRVNMGGGTIGGYSIFTSFQCSVNSTWGAKTYTFDASNISSGSISFACNVYNNNNKGGAISWMEFEYPSA